MICREALDFPVPTREIEPGLGVLEMFHGPTAAFKDVGARFLAAAMARILADGRYARSPVTILVATSGDTGGAVAAAFHRRRGVRVLVLFPEGRVSPRQEHQLTCWGENVTTLRVRGEFDDCQRLAKEAFADPSLRRQHNLCSANSINIGRLLPQAAFYAQASLEHYRRTGRAASYSSSRPAISAMASLASGRSTWACPIDRIVLASNANATVADFLATGQWLPRPTIATLASAMDVGNPSNMERLRNLLPDFADLRTSIESYPVDDEAIRAQIAKDYERYGEVWCPHTATAFWVYDHLPPARKAGRPWIVSATAHPAKFETIVEPVIGRKVEVPPALAELLDRPTTSTPLAPRLEELAKELDSWI